MFRFMIYTRDSQTQAVLECRLYVKIESLREKKGFDVALHISVWRKLSSMFFSPSLSGHVFFAKHLISANLKTENTR